MIYDLSPIIRPETPVWPGDTSFQSRLTWSIADGASVNLSAITTTPHLGSHADAPFHTEPRGDGMSEMPLDRYLGLCRVLRVPPLRDYPSCYPPLIKDRQLPRPVMSRAPCVARASHKKPFTC